MKKYLLIGLIVGIIVGIIISNNFKSQTNSITLPIVAASDDTAMIGNVTINMIDGTGRILFDNNPSIDTDMQYSSIIAIAYAEEYTSKDLSNKDTIIDFNMPLDVLGGDSAGAAITIGMISILEGYELREDIIITGAVNPDGTISRVGELREKGAYVSNLGYKILLVPQGQSRVWRQNITLEEYLNNTIEVREVKTITEALEIMKK